MAKSKYFVSYNTFLHCFDPNSMWWSIFSFSFLRSRLENSKLQPKCRITINIVEMFAKNVKECKCFGKKKLIIFFPRGYGCEKKNLPFLMPITILSITFLTSTWILLRFKKFKKKRKSKEKYKLVLRQSNSHLVLHRPIKNRNFKMNVYHSTGSKWNDNCNK